MPWKAISMIAAFLTGLATYFIVRAMGIEFPWPDWLLPLALAFIVAGSMIAAKRRKGD